MNDIAEELRLSFLVDVHFNSVSDGHRKENRG